MYLSPGDGDSSIGAVATAQRYSLPGECLHRHRHPYVLCGAVKVSSGLTFSETYRARWLLYYLTVQLQKLTSDGDTSSGRRHFPETTIVYFAAKSQAVVAGGKGAYGKFARSWACWNGDSSCSGIWRREGGNNLNQITTKF